MDVAVEKVVAGKGGYTVSIKNIGGYAVPTDVLVEYSDSSKETFHQTAGIWEKNQQAATITINTKKKITYLKLDGGIFMDADEKNNTWGTSSAKPAPIVNLDKYLGVYASKDIPLKITFTKDGNTLEAEATGQDKFQLTNTGKDTFSFEAAGLVITFDTGKNEMNLKQGGGSYNFTKEK